MGVGAVPPKPKGLFFWPMKYFLHSTDAFEDEKITELFLKFGYEGLGLFYTVLEKLGKHEKPVKTDVLKAQLKVGKRLEKCWNFMEQIGIISSNNGETFNERILSYSEMYQIKKEKNREKISQWREKQEVIKNVTSYEPVRNHPKVNKSKVKESKVNVLGEADKSAPQPKSKKILFSESEYVEKEKISLALFGTQYQDANVDYYHEVIGNWSGANQERKIDWLATIKNWMARDMTNGKFIDKNFKPPTNGHYQNGKRPTGGEISDSELFHAAANYLASNGHFAE